MDSDIKYVTKSSIENHIKEIARDKMKFQGGIDKLVRIYDFLHKLKAVDDDKIKTLKGILYLIDDKVDASEYDKYYKELATKNLSEYHCRYNMKDTAGNYFAGYEDLFDEFQHSDFLDRLLMNNGWADRRSNNNDELPF
jgi:hypothetical protein